MANIEIPTYRIFVPNSTFAKEAKPFRHPIFKTDVPATQIMQITRYSIPTENEVIDLIQTVARDFNSFSTTEKYSEERGEIPISEFMRMLPEDERDRIAKGEKDALFHLREHYSQGTYQSGQTYIQITNGVVPNEILDSAIGFFDEKGATAYKCLIDKMRIKNWNLRMRLKGKDVLPNKLEMEYLLDRGVRNCDVFRINGNYGDYQNAAEQIRLLYNVLNSPQEVRKIEDGSEMFLKTRAANTIEEVVLCFSGRKTISGLFEGLGEIISPTMEGQSGSEQEQEPRVNFPYGDYSLN